MPTIRFTQTTATTPEQFIAGLTDLRAGRSESWGHGGYAYTFTRRDDGMTDVDVVVPVGKSLTGRLVGLVVGSVGRRFLVHRFRKTVRAIEARQYEASRATSSGPTMGLVC
jgi:hypothetical protein